MEARSLKRKTPTTFLRRLERHFKRRFMGDN